MSSASEVLFVGSYTLLRREHGHSESTGPRRFHKTHASGRTVTVELSYETSEVVSEVSGVLLSPEVIAELNELNRAQGDAMTPECKLAIEEPLDEIRSTTKQVISLLKYHLRHFDIQESLYSFRSEKWGPNAKDLRDVPSGISVSWVNFSNQPLNDHTQQSVQAALTLDHTPLLAMRHLHRAKLEHMPHHKWIDATIAAELAIKEILARAKPDLEPLLINMQSPPFSKLYGDVLATYLGEESPFRKRLITGQEVRNALVHRPGAKQIDSQEANDYVEAVEGAIFHLLSLLYPKDPLIVEARYRVDA